MHKDRIEPFKYSLDDRSTVFQLYSIPIVATFHLQLWTNHSYRAFNNSSISSNLITRFAFIYLQNMFKGMSQQNHIYQLHTNFTTTWTRRRVITDWPTRRQLHRINTVCLRITRQGQHIHPPWRWVMTQNDSVDYRTCDWTARERDGQPAGLLNNHPPPSHGSGVLCPPPMPSPAT